MEAASDRRHVEALKKAADTIKTLLAENSALRERGPIAVVGLGCRFPGGADTPEHLWDLLAEGRDAVAEIPPERWDLARWWSGDPEAPGRMYVRSAALLEDVKGFDPSFFNITPNEAEALDPQQRLLLEVSWEALEDAGIDARRLADDRTGVFVGLSNYDYIQAHIHSGDPARVNAYSGSGVMFSTAAGRLSYFYDFRGPCITVDTACSSSLAALDQAMKSLRRGDCDLALAGGVSLMLSPDSVVALCKVKALAADGRSRAFDDAATGYGRGEGCGLLVLKRLADAERDGDAVHAVLAGSAVNHDGRSNGLTAPNGLAQQAVIRAALADAGLAADAIDYVEAHGTGTALGDPIEFGALAAVFGKRAAGRELLLGSVKTNIGHTEAAAGVAGVIKVILALRQRRLPKNLHFATPNQHIDWATASIRVVDAITDWPGHAHPRAAGVSSFGLSGTNAHVIVTEPPVCPQPVRAAHSAPRVHVLALSAATRPALAAMAAVWRRRLDACDPGDLAELCATAARRTALRERLAVTGTTVGEFAAILADLPDAHVQPASQRQRPAKGPVFVFSGQGAQYAGMGRALYDSEPVFRAAFDRCAAVVDEDADRPFADLVMGLGATGGMLAETAVTQPALYALQWALVELWASWGVRPAAVVGHSVGEYAAAAAAGALEPEAALRLVAERGRRMQQLPAGGAMAVAFASEAAIAPLLAQADGRVVIAAINAADAVTLAGDAEQLRSFVAALAAHSIAAKPLDVSHAFHSPLMAPMVPGFRSVLDDVPMRPARLPIYSTVTGELLPAHQGPDAAYWSRQILAPVRFHAAIEALRRDGYDSFLEIGPGDGLTGLIQRRPAPALALGSLRPGTDDRRQLARAAAALWTGGLDIDWAAFAGSAAPRRWIAAPHYPFQRKSFWLEVGPLRPDRNATDPVCAATDAAPKQDEAHMTDWRATVTCDLVAVLADISGFAPAEISTTQRLTDMGLDSLMLMRLGQEVERTHGIELRRSQLFQELGTLDDLADYVMRHTTPGRTPAPDRPAAPAAATAAAAVAPQPAPLATTEPAAVAAADAAQPLFQQQLHYLAQVASQNLNSITELARQQLAWAGSGAASSASTVQVPAIQAPSVRKPTVRSPAPTPSPPAVATSATVLRFPAAAPAPERPKGTQVAALRGINLAGARLTAKQQDFVEVVVREHVGRTGGSKALTQDSRDVLADWKNTLFFWGQLKEAKYPIVSAWSAGARFGDVDGNTYIDVAMGMGVHFFGHKPAFVHAALEAQMAAGLELGTQCKLTGATARLVRELTGAERVAFCNTGSESVMVALRLARAATERSTVVIFKNSFHGVFDGVLAVEVDGVATPIGLGTPAGMIEDVVLLDYGSPAALEYIEEHGSTLAAVLVEPVQSRHPDLQPHGFLKTLRRLARAAGTALIFDEMITGFRILPGGAQAWFGVDADIVLFGKIVGGGLPVGVVAGKARFLDYIDGGAWAYGDRSAPRSPMIYFGGTFCRNPATMATTHAALSHMKAAGPALQETANALTTAFCDRLNLWFERHLVPLRALHFSSQWRLAPVGGDDQNPIEMELLYLQMMRRGIYTWERRISFFSTAHGPDEIAAVFDAVTASIEAIREGGFAWSVEAYPEPQFVALSSAQRRLFALSQLPGGELPYHLPQAFWVDGPLDFDRLDTALRGVIQRHESLRTGFLIVDGQAVAKRVAEPRFEIERINAPASGVEPLVAGFFRPFDLAQAPLLRVAVVAVGPDRHLLLTDAHHIAIDGLSSNIIAVELMALYEGRPLPPVGYDLRRCLAIADAADARRNEADAAFWRDELAGAPPPLALPTDRPRPIERDFAGDTVTLTLGPETTRRLRAMGRPHGASLYIVLLAAWSGFLHRLSGQEDIVIGGAVSGRHDRELAGAVGMFVNTVAFRTRPRPDLPFAEHLAAVARSSLAVYDHQNHPFEAIAALSGPGEPGRNPVFDTMLSYENATERAFRLDQLTFTRHQVHVPAAMFDLAPEVIEEDEALTLRISYATALFDRATVARWAVGFERLVTGVLEDPDRPLGRIDLLSADERRLIARYNDTTAAYPAAASLVDLFAGSVARHGERPAVVFGTVALSYAELDQRANRLAAALAARVRPGALIGIVLDRSERVAISLLAVLKAGCAYVPLDPAHPIDLLQHMLTDAGCAAVLTSAGLVDRLPAACRSLALDVDTPGEGHAPALAAPRPEDAAYVIYTSGSTGRPKGCVVTHRNVVRLLVNDRHDFSFGAADVWLCAHSFSFDFSVWEVWGALAYGGCVVIAGQEAARDPEALLALVRRHRVSVLNQTPGAFYGLSAAALRQPPHDLGDHLRMVIFGGDRLEPTYLRAWAAVYPPDWLALINMYGITETTVHVSYYRLTAADIRGAPGRSLIGRPLPETTIVALNSLLEPQPVGVPGELWVGGSGVCRGYLNRPELDAERFVEIDGRRLYRTGDIGRLRADMVLEYIGRNDHQVQVRGHRVELSGVEQRLAEHSRVEKALVIDRAGASGTTELVAYVIGDAALTAHELRAHLAQSLPEHAIPAYFVPIAAFPLTENGKLDRAALPVPEAALLPTGKDFAAPRSPGEDTIAAIWREVLSVPQVGIDDNYFLLGGDSIKALQIVSRMHRAGLRVTLAQVLSARTVANLAKLADTNRTPASAAAAGSTTAGLTPIQNWLLEWHGAAPGHFNNATLMAAAERIDTVALQAAITAVETHHPALRLTLDLGASPPRQVINPALAIRLEVMELDGPAALTAHATAAQGEFDVTRAPLLRVILYRLPASDRVLVLCHHLVIDGVSWRILLEDLGDAYQALRSGTTPTLPLTSRPWLDWARILQSASQGADILAELPYWTAVEAIEVPPVPCDFEDPVNSAADLREIFFELDAARTHRLLTVAPRRLGTDLHTLLLTALAIACRDCFALERIRVRLEGHGREDIEPDADFSRTVGWFTSLSPVVLDVAGVATLDAAVARVRETLTRIPRKGIGYGILRYLTPAALRPGLVFGPEPEIGFNYLGQFEAEAEGGLRVADEPTGPVVGGLLRRPDVLEVEPIVVSGVLSVKINYGQRLHTRATMRRLCDAMAAALTLLAGDEPDKAGPRASSRPEGNREANRFDGAWLPKSRLEAGGPALLAPTDGTPALPAEAAPAGLSPLLLQRLGLPVDGIEAVLPLSPLQEGMLFHALSGDRTAYCQQFACRMTGPLDIAHFVASWQLVGARHRVLRAAILALPGDAPRQAILRDRPLSVRVEDLSTLPADRRHAAMEALAAADRDQGFDLERDPLLRVTVARLAPTDTEVFWSNHHIIVDGWSITILWQEVMAAYEALIAGREPALPPPPPIETYLAWLGTRDSAAARRFWTAKLADCPAPASLPGIAVGGRTPGYALKEYVFELEDDHTRDLIATAARLEVTLSTVVQSLWAILLAQYAGTDDVVFGVITSGRPAELDGVEDMVGMFLQPVPVRVRVAPDDSFVTLADRMQRFAVESEPFQHVPLADLQRLSGVRRVLFDHVLVFENYPLAASETDAGLRIDDVRVFQQMHYDFSVLVNPGERLQVIFTFNSNAVSAAVFAPIETQFRRLVAAVLDDVKQPLRAIDLADGADAASIGGAPASSRPEGNRIDPGSLLPVSRLEAGGPLLKSRLEAGGAPMEVPSAAGTVLDLFERQVELQANAPAIEQGEATLSYRALDDRAIALAHVLKGADVGVGVPVALFLRNGIDYVASVLAVQKAGGIFVPFDVDQPARRHRLLMDRVAPAVIVTDRSLRAGLAASLGTAHRRLVVWRPDGSLDCSVEADRASSLAARPRPGDPMYVMYTSGSTGEPKAILSSHEAVHQFIAWETAELGVGTGVRVGNLALTTFDVSLRDIFLPLTAGGVVCVPPHDARRDAGALAAWMATAGIEVAHVVPSLFRQVLKALEERPRPLPRLAHLLFAGEILRGADVERTRRALGDAVQLRNLYGPSETTLAKCCLAIGAGPLDAARAMPVGTPLPGVRMLIVKDGRLAAPGAIGEIYIAPPFKPLGYFRDAERTAERFVVCPPEWGGAGALYRTGDLGRRLANGMIEVCGRLDGQVKVNGIRIELAEVERAVMASGEIDQAVAVVHKRSDGDNALACYYTEKQPLEPTELRRRLALDLPQGMIPHFFLCLEAFPLNLNGKVDRRALPKPEELIADRIRYVPPAGQTEERIAAIWAEVLGLKRVGVVSPFFEVGGDSLRAIRVLTRVNQEFAGELTIGGFFARPTIRDMAQALRPPTATAGGRIAPVAAAADYALSHAQRRLWILAQMGGHPAAYTIPAAYLLDGPLDADALVCALEALPARHEALRTVFITVGDAPRQRILADSGFTVDRVDLSGAPDPVAAATELARRHANHRFDLGRGPLLAASLLVLGPSRHVLLVNVHHIVSDVWSVTIMVEEILQLARGERLPPLRIHYKDYAAWEASGLSSPKTLAERDWWHRQLSALPDRLELPADRPTPSLPSFEGDRVSVALDAADLNALRGIAQAGRGTLFAGLLAIVAALLHRYTAQREMILGTPVACRGDADLERQVGFYVNTLPLRIAVERAEPFAALFTRVSDGLVAALDHSAYPFDLLVDEIDLPRDDGRPPLFDVMVVFQDAGQRDFSFEGVTVAPFGDGPKVAKLPLTFEFVETATQCLLHLEYATDLFDRPRIERLSEHFARLLSAAVADPRRPLSALDCLGAAERQLLRGSRTTTDLPADATVPSVFAAQVAAGPDRLAVIHESVHLSYAELDRRANALAQALVGQGIGRGDIVGVLLDRSERLTVAFLGIVKCGAVYLPLDPTYPAERLDYMLTDAGAALVVTEPAHAGAAAARGHRTLDLESLGTQSAPPPGAPEPGDVAYLIYTSGSTGRPKGALLEHRGAVNLAFSQRHGLGIEPRHRVLQFAPSSFDASVWEMLMALLNGACLVIAGPERIREPRAFAAYLAEHAVTVATLPPVYLAELDDAALVPLELLVTAGEAPNRERALRLAGQLIYVNAYGPTEATVCATWHRVDPVGDRDRPIPIGRAIPGTEVLVLDRAGDLAPIGVTGEIHVGGRGLARGYLGRPALTEAAFVAHPFAPGERLYRTGDQGVVAEDGTLGFVGRTDRQVKLRGHRVELGEIERTIARHPSVAEVVVRVRSRPRGDELVAYVVPDGVPALDALRIDIARSLPDHMIPARWVTLDALPVLPSGKVDHAGLPDPGAEVAEPVASDDPMEAVAAEVWSAVLHRADFGRHDRFFEVGGDSIRAIQVVGRLRSAGYRIEMRDFLAAPTVAALATRLAAAKAAPAAEPAPAAPYSPLSADAVEGLFRDD